MVRLQPLTHREIDARHEQADELVNKIITQVLHDTAYSLSGTPSINDLTIITRFWNDHVDELLGLVQDTFREGVDRTRDSLREALRQVLTAGPSLDDFEIPEIPNEQAEQMLANARNRLVRTGNDVWEAARGQLLDGMQRGESIRQLRDRLTASVPFAAPRAQLVARSEVGNAMNQGSLSQMRALNIPTMTREWIAVHDSRTRLEHAEMDGQKVPINTSFAIGYDPGEMYNCRCTTGYIVPDDDKFVESVTSTPDELVQSINQNVQAVSMPRYDPIYAEDLSTPDARRSPAVTMAEFQQYAAEGERIMAERAARAAEPVYLDRNFEDVIDRGFTAAREPWGGMTIDLHTGVEVEQGQMAYALTVRDPGMSSIGIPADQFDRATFEKALVRARQKYAQILRRDGVHLGIFHDDDVKQIQIDPVLVVDNLEEVHKIGAYTHSVGGAYSFSDGDGYWPPHVVES